MDRFSVWQVLDVGDRNRAERSLLLVRRYERGGRRSLPRNAPLGASAANRRRYSLPIGFVQADAEALPFSDDSFDTVGISLALCTVPDPGSRCFPSSSAASAGHWDESSSSSTSARPRRRHSPSRNGSFRPSTNGRLAATSTATHSPWSALLGFSLEEVRNRLFGSVRLRHRKAAKVATCYPRRLRRWTLEAGSPEMTLTEQPETEAAPAISFDDVQAAAKRLRGVAHRTPVLTSRTLDELTGAHVFLKAESFQRIGAFKFRGAYNAISALDTRGSRSRRRDRIRRGITRRRSRSRPSSSPSPRRS